MMSISVTGGVVGALYGIAGVLAMALGYLAAFGLIILGTKVHDWYVDRKYTKR